ncbi:alanine--tRNA ligase [Pseudochelatococcus contaminans]|uniref:Alanine--tRNA ligase n=1 Tax=Pseudochelatococcus contaminans TaxID=1538103 RepID=A0A7W5Z633_9HYPH|nr:alanine--tRNA ligase [Pseudochelatococcus contaminans]MBB3810835.1 alanyl-tRNA synthetase [Pseudochelatococcus contaminans]
MSGVNEIRSTFLDYFSANGHEIVPSSSLVPRNDPTLMFTSAGMVPFKNVFTGAEKRPYSRATSAQKCLRAGGKHNDLDNVGYTARHHTFFEMLGNFSFGDYFKENAIELAWKLVTREFGLPESKLLVTVFSEDEDAALLWKKIAGLSDSKIIRISTSDNFWSMGDTGPCGPCSEIFYDHGDKIAGGPPGSPDEDGDRFIEIWNLVFMQYDQVVPGERQLLPRPSIDTGMGLERISAVLQGTHDNYSTDLFRALIEAVATATGVDPAGPQGVSHRVIADHLRASAFLVADGVLPSNEGRGYVARRIMRRAMRHAQLLGARDPLMWRLVPALVRQMGEAYPELVRAQSLIGETLHLEEKRFRKTLERGLSILDAESRELSAGTQLSGDVAFTLYDTYGFPLDLTQDALRPRSIGVDVAGFNAAMERQRQQARAAWSGSGEAATETLWFALKDKVGSTEFLGYETEAAEGVVTAIVRDGEEVESLSAGEEGFVLFNQTPFYAESGGQVGDIGKLSGADLSAEITGTTKKLGALYLHRVQVTEGMLVIGSAVTLQVDAERRSAIRANHSATHLLHEALREILGDHVAQKGSLVTSDRLRFDFSHPGPISAGELRQIEELANTLVLRNEPVVTRSMAVDEAIESGARALFGEKYGDEVRVVSMGTRPEIGGKPFSVELCGGTHVSRTGDIGIVRVLSESAVASGVRRIEAMTGKGARRHLVEESQLLQGISELLRTPVSELGGRLEALIEERRKFERDLTEARKKLALGVGSGEDPIREVAGTNLLARIVSGIEPKDLKSLVDDAKKRIGSGIVAIVGVAEDGKAGIVVGVAGDAGEHFDAVALVRVAAEKLGGKGGGGRRDLAQAGGPDSEQAQAALDAIAEAIAAT